MHISDGTAPCMAKLVTQHLCCRVAPAQQAGGQVNRHRPLTLPQKWLSQKPPQLPQQPHTPVPACQPGRLTCWAAKTSCALHSTLQACWLAARCNSGRGNHHPSIQSCGAAPTHHTHVGCAPPDNQQAIPRLCSIGRAAAASRHHHHAIMQGGARNCAQQEYYGLPPQVGTAPPCWPTGSHLRESSHDES